LVTVGTAVNLRMEKVGISGTVVEVSAVLKHPRTKVKA